MLHNGAQQLRIRPEKNVCLKTSDQGKNKSNFWLCNDNKLVLRSLFLISYYCKN